MAIPDDSTHPRNPAVFKPAPRRASPLQRLGHTTQSLATFLHFARWNADLILTRTLVYVLLTGAIVLVYVSSIIVLTEIFSRFAGNPSGSVLVLSTLLAAACFRPLRNRLQNFVDRRFYHNRADFGEAFLRLEREVRSIVELPELLGLLIRRVGELLHIAYGAVYVREADGRLHMREDYRLPEDMPGVLLTDPDTSRRLDDGEIILQPKSMAYELLIPLLAPQSGREALAVLALGPRLSRQHYSHNDRVLLKGLADQAGTALYVAQLVSEKQKVGSELDVAGRIQASFLPGTLPEIPGWQLSVMLEPARQTGGDFYDVIPLPKGRIGLVIADVADKGVGAALYMAVTRTILRTYAVDHHARPAWAMLAANQRILMDTTSDLFVTVFYGVLDPVKGALTYCNAGHNPPYLLSAENPAGVQKLRKTGMALGVQEDAAWKEGTVRFAPGDVLILYTDGITEAQNTHGTFFGPGRLLELVQANRKRSAYEIQRALVARVHEFAGRNLEADDICAMILIKE
jgi:serine phosphatase RsbU (regulator of sigma subunit)